LLVIIIRQQAFYLLGEYACFDKYHITSIRQWRILSRVILMGIQSYLLLFDERIMSGIKRKWWAIQDLNL
jgi:hypothetical protein